MAKFSAIALVSQALEVYLLDAITANVPGVAVKRDMLQPPPAATTPTLTVFLYDVAEDGTVRNSPPVVTEVSGKRLVTRAPVPLILRYMLTPWSQNADETYRMLGCAIAALGDSRTMLRRAMHDLSNPPTGIDDVLHDVELLSINMAQLTLEEKSKVWWAIQQPFHLSVIYEIRVLPIDLFGDAGIEGAPVKVREIDSRVPAGVGS
jgi:Pvc16 N-terminal domain